jgi:hypothetical protein
VIIAQGGAHAGWSFYVKDDRPKFAYNYLGSVTTIASTERLPAGHVIRPLTVTDPRGNATTRHTACASLIPFPGRLCARHLMQSYSGMTRIERTHAALSAPGSGTTCGPRASSAAMSNVVSTEGE